MAGLLWEQWLQLPEQERDYDPMKTSLVLAAPPRSNHQSSLSELVVGPFPYQPPTAGRREGEQETEPLHRGELYIVVWGGEMKKCTQE